MRVGVAEGFKEGMLLGTRNDPLSTLGKVQGQKAAELLMDIQVQPHSAEAQLLPPQQFSQLNGFFLYERTPV